MPAKIMALVFVPAMLVAAPGLVAFLTRDASAEDTFEKLSGAQIRARVAGMEITDDVHWRDVYERNGTLKSYSMGRVLTGTWRVENDQLCLDLEEEPTAGCYEVWVSGNKVELRPEGRDSPLEGVLQKPTDRQ